MAPRVFALCAALASRGQAGRTVHRHSLLGAAVLPHGDFAYEPYLLQGHAPRDVVQQAEALGRGCSAAGAFVSTLGAELLVLITPHGLQTTDQIAIYGSPLLKGPAYIGSDVNMSFGDGSIGQGDYVDFEAPGDPNMARRLAKVLNKADPGSATVITGFGDAEPQPLRWGEVLPLRHIWPGARTSTKIIVMGLPRSRLTKSGKLAPKFRKLGAALGAFLDGQQLRSAVLVSTDLAHTHWSNTSFGRNPNAKDFDEACGRWAETIDADVFPVQESIVDSVKTCGWLGLPFLQGAFEATEVEGLEGRWQGTLLSKPVALTYYGMMVATFHRD